MTEALCVSLIHNLSKGIEMTKKLYGIIALAMIVAPVMAAPVSAQSPQGAPASQCPPGTQYVPPGRDGAGNPVAAYCASAPAQGTNDPYSGRNAPDPSASPTGGAGQFIPQTR